jgi:probable selenium-dependent hydroxylase accessory protein YqeC
LQGEFSRPSSTGLIEVRDRRRQVRSDRCPEDSHAGDGLLRVARTGSGIARRPGRLMGLCGLCEALGLRSEEVISLVGGGGKTTLMFRLAREITREARTVITTTTTRILVPTADETPCLFISRDRARLTESVEILLREYGHVTIVGRQLGGGKLKGIDPEAVADLRGLSISSTVIVEADGAARKPVKAPREHEPVIPSNTSLVIALVGIDGVDVRLDEEHTFQAERISQLTGIPLGATLSSEAAAVLITHPQGIFKGAPRQARVAVFINKTDLPRGVARAQELAARVLDRKHPQIERIVLGRLMSDPPVIAGVIRA